MTTESFNTFVLGQGTATSAAPTDSFPLIQGGGTKRALISTITSYNVVSPTGGDDTSMLSAAFANSATRPVMLSFGQYQVSGPLVIPIGGVVVGAGEVDAAQPWAVGNVFKCCLNVVSPGSWSSHLDADGRVAVVYPGSYSIYASSANTLVDGVQWQNVTWSYCVNIFVVNCNTGFSAVSDGNIAGDGGNPQGNNNIANIIRGGAARQCQAGFTGYGINGGYCSDMEISDFWVSATQAAAAIECGSGFGNARIVNCRIEDQGSGLVIESTGNVIVNACLFDRNIAPITVKFSNNITVSGCMSSSAGNGGSGSGGTGTHIYFAKSFFGLTGQDNIQLVGNVYNQGAAATSYTYGVESGNYLTNSVISESGAGNAAVYQDAYSAAQLAQFRASSVLGVGFTTLTPASNTFTPDLTIATNFSITLTHGVTNTIAAPLGVADLVGKGGWFEIIESSTGTDTIAWNAAFLGSTVPSLTGAANSKNYVPYTVNPAGAVVLGAAVQNAH